MTIAPAPAVSLAPSRPTISPIPVDAGAAVPRRSPAQQHTRGVVGALNAEWRVLGRSRCGRTALAGWGVREPALAGCRDLGDVVDAAARRGQDEMLLALLRLARDGELLAARTALQAMLGAAVRLARRTVAHAQGDLDESLSRAVGALWQVVRHYPVERRNCRPADGISLDVLAALTGAGRPRPPEVPGGMPCELADVPEEIEDEVGVRDLFWSVAHPRAVRACSDEQLVLLLAWGVRHRVVTIDDARLLHRLHSPADPENPVSCRELAEELGLGHAAVRQRVSRATRRMAAAVAEIAEEGRCEVLAAA